MKVIESEVSAELITLVEKAADFHGHLGPFLVIGVRVGILAKRILNTNAVESNKLQVTSKLPLLTPFSCILDGIQATTQCTVGNQKLRIENSRAKIIAYFERENFSNGLSIHVNPQIIDELKNRYSKGASNEELAREITSMSESQLFIQEKQ
jgi:formylmethanofuran dehydrogenase subunit E